MTSGSPVVLVVDDDALDLQRELADTDAALSF
jgi:hypothetical protein